MYLIENEKVIDQTKTEGRNALFFAQHGADTQGYGQTCQEPAPLTWKLTVISFTGKKGGRWHIGETPTSSKFNN